VAPRTVDDSIASLGRTAPGNPALGVLLFSRTLIPVRKNYLARRADAWGLMSQRGRSRLVVQGHSWAACGLVTTSSRPPDGSPFADRRHDGNAGRAAIFRDVVSGRSFLWWPWRRGATRCRGSRRFTPAYGAGLFQYLSPRETVRYFPVSLLGSPPESTKG